jgi:hypothetical protein
MKKHIFTATIVFFALCAGYAMPSISPFQPAMAAENADTVKHIVLFAFKEGTDLATIDAIIKAAMAMPQETDSIQSMEWGSEINAQARSEGYSHCLNMQFKNKADLESYLPSAAHEAFKKIAVPHVEKLLVFDYNPNK